MEKNRNRTDLLAAGRKKLQQFQKKKEKKGGNSSSSSSHGRSSHKTSGNEHDSGDADAALATPSVTVKADEGELPQAVDAELASTDLSVSTSVGEGEIDSSVADAEHVDSSGLSVMAVEVDAELRAVDSLVSPSVAMPREGETDMDCMPESSFGAEGVTRMDAEVVPVGSSITEMMVDGDDAKLVPIDSLASPASEETGKEGVALAEIDREDREFPEMPQIESIVGDPKSDSVLGPVQEAECSGSDQCDGSVEGSCVPLQDGESSEVGSLRVENESHKGLAVSEIPDTRGLAKGGTHFHGPISAEATCEAGSTDDVVEHGEMSGGGLEIHSLSQHFATEQDDDVQGKIAQEGSIEDMHKQQYFPECAVVIESKSMGEPLEVETASIFGGQAISLDENAGSVDIYGLAKVLEGLDEEQVGFLHKLIERADLREIVSRILPEVGFADGSEGLKLQLYLTNIAKDFLNMQLAEQIEEQMEVNRQDQLLLDEVSKLRTVVKETQESNMSISEELVQCRSQVWATAAGKEELELKYLSARKEIDELSARAYEFQSKLEQSQEEVTPLLAELAGCKALLGALQTENANLTGNFLTATEERKKLEEEKEYFVNENTKLAVDLLAHKERLVMAHDKQVQLEADLKEEMMYVEQITEENIYLSNSLDLHKDKIKEVIDKYQQLYAEAAGAGNQPESSIMFGVFSDKAIEDSQLRNEKFDGLVASDQVESVALGHLQGSLVLHTEKKVFDDYVGLRALKGHLEEAEKIVQKLEKAIHELQSHSVSLSRTGGKTVGVSKLIQAFESKVHHEDVVSDEVPVTEERSTDPFMLAKEQTSNLRAVLKQMELDAENANKLFKDEQDRIRLTTVALNDLEAECETQKQQNNTLEAKNDEMVKKLTECQTRVDDLLNQFNELQKNADETVGIISNQVGYLQKEVDVNTSILEHQRNSLMASISEAVEKLDTCIGLLVPTGSTGSDYPDIVARIVVSVDAATKEIQGLHEKLEAADLEHERISNSYEVLNQKLTDVHGKNEVAVGLLDKIYSSLRKLVNDSCGNVVDSVMDVKAEELLNLVSSNCDVLIGQLLELLSERQHLLSLNNGLEAELVKTTQDLEVLNNRCLDLANKVEENENSAHSDVIAKLVEDVEGVIQPDVMAIDSDKPPVMCLEVLVGFLLQKYKEASEQVSLSKHCLQEYTTRPVLSADDWTASLHTLLREEFGAKVLELSELRGKINQLQSLNFEQEDETRILKENLSTMEGALELVRSELQAKGAELEQSEQRLSSVREKLGIAVSKGKGLIVQRDSLKQSLAEKSSELDKCLQELQSKDAIIHDIEAKFKTFSESGERVEALESELSYIRNSATALRESFLLKDSVLQRIEEILENLELPEHFHSRDTIEKIEWLARSIPRSSLPLTDWDQKSSVGGSYSDGGFVVMDAWKEDLQTGSNSELDDLRRKYDELQNKFYGLAEHNEMLEQSLVDRNDLVQRWEEVLNRIDIPLRLRSLEPVDRIDWLGRALPEAQHERESLLLKIENLELSSDSLLAELEESQKKLSDLKATLGEVGHEKELLSENLKKLRNENEELSAQAVQEEVDKGELQKEIADLHKKLVGLQEKLVKYDHIENDIVRLMGLVNDALPDHDLTDVSNSGTVIDYLEGSLRKIIDRYTALSLEKSVPKDMEKELVTDEADAEVEEQRLKDALDAKEQELLILKEEHDGALGNLVLVKGERDTALEKCQSLMLVVEQISKERDHLQEQIGHEEQKSASAREKLNVAVRKGKALVQQRDSLKLTIGEMNSEMERLKGELNQRGDALVQYEQRARDFLAHSGKAEALESENVFLRSRLAETEQNLQDGGRTMSGFLTALRAIDVGGQVDVIDPVQKMEKIGKLTHDLHAAAIASEHEAKKSKRAAELLLAELNEVQERADSLQEELAKAEAAVAGLSTQRDITEAERMDALSNLEQFIAVRSEERRKQNADLVRLKAGIDQLMKQCSEFANMIANVFSKDLELINHVGAGMVLLLKELNGSNANNLLLHHASGGFFPNIPVNEEKFSAVENFSEIFSQLKMQDDNVVTDLFSLVECGLQECMREIDYLKEKCHKHSITYDHHGARLPKMMETFKREISFQKESSESLKRDISHLQSLTKEKDTEINVMHKNIALLYEACNSSILEIESREAHMLGNDLASRVVHVVGNTGSTLEVSTWSNGQDSASEETFSFTEEHIRTLGNTLFSAVKRSANMHAELEESNERELKATISNLQKELQEKDIHQNRICAELVTQIKEAEATARNYLVDLDSTKTQRDGLEKQVEVMKNERRLLELRVNEQKDSEALLKELQERIKSLTDGLNAKDQEIESLMQALDEEESQMEGLAARIEELEKIVQEKNLAVESLEASRGKAMSKLSTTVSKFNELHHMSESLLSEVKNLESQLQGRDAEISFLRQEVTRCTNDVLTLQESNKRKSTEIEDLLTWLNGFALRFGVHDVHLDDLKGSRIRVYTEILEKHITSVISELNDLRVTAQSREALLQAERSKLEELVHKGELLEVSIREKESQLELLQEAQHSGQPDNMNTTELLEVEPMRNKRAVTLGPIAPHVRSVRKVNNDKVAIGIDMESGGSALDDEDDKGHGFTSLTMSRIVPRASRPIADKIDGLWVSGDRVLMRQPTLRLGIVLYWIMLHVLLASSFV